MATTMERPTALASARDNSEVVGLMRRLDIQNKSRVQAAETANALSSLISELRRRESNLFKNGNHGDLTHGVLESLMSAMESKADFLKGILAPCPITSGEFSS